MPKEMDSLMGNTYPGKIWQTFMEQAHEGLEWLDFLPYTQIPDASSGEMEAEDAATDEGNAQGETPAENGDTPQENVTDTPDTPQGSATDVPSSSQETGRGYRIRRMPHRNSRQTLRSRIQQERHRKMHPTYRRKMQRSHLGKMQRSHPGRMLRMTPQETAPGAP